MKPAQAARLTTPRPEAGPAPRVLVRSRTWVAILNFLPSERHERNSGQDCDLKFNSNMPLINHKLRSREGRVGRCDGVAVYRDARVVAVGQHSRENAVVLHSLETQTSQCV